MPELRRLLVATDGSEPAKHAARFAGRIASRFDGAVRAVSVIQEPSVWIGTDAYLATAGIRSDRAYEHARRISDEAASLATQNGCARVEAMVEIGDPARTIVALAEEYKAHAIVMGRRGTGNVSGLFLGSVSTRVSHLSDRTVITVRGRDADIARVLVAIDGSEHSMRAVELASVIAKGFGADLDILHVAAMADLVPLVMSGVDAREYNEFEDSLRQARGQIVNEAQRIAADLDVEATTTIEVGDAATRIVGRAADLGSDVICIGRRGLGSVAGLLLGSVSHSVAHGADQTVITVS
jgi:nucleotide-binding universal stress UspA family protein